MSAPAELRRLRAEVGELVAKHEQAKGSKEFTKYADDPAGFFRDILRCEPWSRQQEIATLVRDSPRTVVMSANGIGKDWLCARLALWWAFARRGFVVLTGPTERQVKHILMREVRKAFAMAPELPGELYAMELRIGDSGEAGILAFTSDNADRLVGFHHPRLLVCVTEGQGVSEEAYEAAGACVTDAENRLFVYGNPTNPTGPFYRVAQSDSWKRLRIAASEHPNVVSGRAEIPGAVSREWIDNMREEYGEGSGIYRARVLAEFPEESLEGLIKREWLKAAYDRWDKRAGSELAFEALNALPVLALDIARFGPDKSALAHVRGPIVESVERWQGAAVTDSVDRLMDRARTILKEDIRHRRPQLAVDEPGLGGGAVDIIRAKGWRVEAFNGGRTAFDHGRFANVRAESHWHLRTLLENGRIALPRDAALEEEALAIEWQINKAGQIQIAAKDLIRQTLGRSPDTLDAVVIGLYESMHRHHGTVSFVSVSM